MFETMPLSDEHSEERTLVEAFGEMFAAGGGSSMAGRLLGWLMLCDPPGQSTTQLAEALGAAKSSVSTAARTLVQAGLAERYRRSGSREVYYRMSASAWEQMLERTADDITRWRRLAERGRAIDTRNPRFAAMHDLFRFYEDRWPDLLAAWKKEHE